MTLRFKATISVRQLASAFFNASVLGFSSFRARRVISVLRAVAMLGISQSYFRTNKSFENHSRRKAAKSQRVDFADRGTALHLLDLRQAVLQSDQR